MMLRAHTIAELPPACRVRLTPRRFSLSARRRAMRTLSDLAGAVSGRLFNGDDTRAVVFTSCEDRALAVLATAGGGTWSQAVSPQSAAWTPEAPTPATLVPVEPGSFEPKDPGTPAGLSSTRGFDLAVSTAKLFHSEDRAETSFGDARHIARDLQQLGCTVAWHPGRMQILLNAMFPGPDDGGAGIPLDLDAVATQVQSSAPLAWLRSFITDVLIAEGIDLELLITFLTLGGGEDSAGPADETGQHAQPLPAVWSDDHVGQTVVADDGVTYAFNSDGDLNTAWDVATIDPSRNYKLHYYRVMARAVGAWLESLRVELLGSHGVDISRYFAGIELGNELTDRHCRTPEATGDDYEGDAESWADFYYWCASAIWEQAEWVPLWLPAVASYTLEEKAPPRPTMTWPGRFSFIGRVVKRVGDAVAANPFGYNDPPTVQDLIAGLDNHYYHHKADYQPLSWIIADLLSLRRMLDDEKRGAPGALLSVQEGGVNVVCETGDAGRTPDGAEYDWGCESGGVRTDGIPSYPEFDAPELERGLLPTNRPDRVSCVRLGDRFVTATQPTGANDYQAIALWCRLAAARCAGADIVGWHTPMSMPSGTFAGMGLRRDQHATDNDPSVAYQRPAYDAYQPFGTLLGSYRSCRRLDVPGAEFPGVDDATVADVHKVWQPPEAWYTAPHDVWVIEFSDPVGGAPAFAYLLFMDPDHTSAGICCELTLTGTSLSSRSSSASLSVTEYFLQPTDMVTGAADAGGYPLTLWFHAASALLPPSPSSPVGWATAWTLTLGQSQYPRLLTCPRPLSIASVAAEPR